MIDVIMMPAEPPVPDGWLQILFTDGTHTSFEFSNMPKGWRWDPERELLVISEKRGRREFPREHIKQLAVTNNSPTYVTNRKIWEAFNGETCSANFSE